MVVVVVVGSSSLIKQVNKISCKSRCSSSKSSGSRYGGSSGSTVVVVIGSSNSRRRSCMSALNGQRYNTSEIIRIPYVKISNTMQCKASSDYKEDRERKGKPT